MIVIADTFGQLGNSLFRFAHFAAAAEEHGLAIAYPAFRPYAEHFPAFAGDALCRHPRPRRPLRPSERRRRLAARAALLAAAAAERLRLRGPVRALTLAPGEECDLSDARFLAMARGRGVLLVRGWLFRDEAALERHGDAVRRLFTPGEAHLLRVRDALAAARGSAEVLVGVHMRRGDYAGFEGGRWFYSEAQYRTVLERVRDALAPRSVAFLAASDDAQLLAALAGEVTPAPGHLVEDIYALAGCDAIVGPPSTFSAWAAFHGERPLHHVRDPDAAIDPEELGA